MAEGILKFPRKAQFHLVIIVIIFIEHKKMVRNRTEDRINDFRILWHFDIEGPKEKKHIGFLWCHCYTVMEVVCVCVVLNNVLFWYFFSCHLVSITSLLLWSFCGLKRNRTAALIMIRFREFVIKRRIRVFKDYSFS